MASKCNEDGLEGLISFDSQPSAERLRDIAWKELGETKELKQKCLEQLKALVKDHNVTTITNDEFLLRFLRTKKFDIQKSFKALRNYSDMRAAICSQIMKLDAETVKKFLAANFFYLLPYRDRKERLIYFFRPGGWNINVCSEEEMMMMMVLFGSYAAEQQSTQINGAVGIVDCQIMGWKEVYLTANHGRFSANFLLSCLPARYGEIHMINEVPFLKYCFLILRPFLPQKIRDKFHFHGDSTEGLLQYFEPEVLPDIYGGSLGPLSTDHIVDKLINYLQKMKDEQCYFLERK